MGNSSSASQTGISQDDFKDIIYGNIIYTFASQKNKNIKIVNPTEIDGTDKNMLPKFEENYYKKNMDVIDNYVDNNILNSYANLSKFMKFIKCEQKKTQKTNHGLTGTNVEPLGPLGPLGPLVPLGPLGPPVKLSQPPTSKKLSLDDMTNITEKTFLNCIKKQQVVSPRPGKKSKSIEDKINDKINQLNINISNERNDDTLSDVTRQEEYDQESI